MLYSCTHMATVGVKGLNYFYTRQRCTCDADVAGLEVGREVTLTRSYVDQCANADVARLATRALRVEQRYDVVGTSEVVVAADTAS